MECEFKWNISNAAEFDRITHSELIAPLIQSSEKIQMEARYFDTADKKIARMRGGLRLRRENGESVVCLKLSPKESLDGAYKAREEYECYAPDIRSGLLNLPSEGAPQDLCDSILQSDLLELGRTDCTRLAYELAYKNCTCELSCDSGKITRRGRSIPVCEMELELKNGNPDDFHTLAVTLEQTFLLEPQPLSKLARMLKL